MGNTYIDFMDEITADELFDRLIQFGLFSEKLPPIFDCTDFLSYCKKPGRPIFPKQWYPFATFDSMRNTNIPRPIGIPTPMAHERLCACIRDNWIEIKKHFKTTTSGNKHIISRIHVRKMKDTDSLFKMNYNNWKIDGTPVPDISFGKKYLIKADISKCFPSIYSHAIPWAIATKTVAKRKAKDKVWYNDLDEETRNTTNGETHGLLIGPHTSNLISEIVLCKIDEQLSEKWEYIRNIDDYSCYVNSQEEADEFLIDLNGALKEYGLLLNHKKTEVLELPQADVEKWTHQIQDKTVYLGKFHPYVDYHEVQGVLDFVIDLMKKNKDNASILYYTIKLLSNYNLTKNAKSYLDKTVTSLAMLYPYIVPLLDTYIYEPNGTNQGDIKEYINKIYERYLPKKYFEAASYTLYFSVKNNVIINTFDVNEIIDNKDCILLLCALIYCRHFKLINELDLLKKHAKKIKANGDFEEYWPFAYECLTVGLVDGPWKEIKKDKVSFLKLEYR